MFAEVFLRSTLPLVRLLFVGVAFDRADPIDVLAFFCIRFTAAVLLPPKLLRAVDGPARPVMVVVVR